MTGKPPVWTTNYSSTEDLPPPAFARFVFDVTNFKEVSRWMLILEREVTSQPYMWTVPKGKKDRNYEGYIKVWGGFRNLELAQCCYVSLGISSPLTLLNCTSLAVYCVEMEHTVNAELLGGETSVTLGSKSLLKQLGKSDSVEIHVGRRELQRKLKRLGGTPVTLRVTVELKRLPWPTQQSLKWTTVATTSPSPQQPPYLEVLRSNELLSDLTISCGGKEFRGHKLILSAASPVFARMLTAPMTEADGSKIIIEDVEPESMTLLMDFIYTGQCNPNTSDETLDLLYCAEKYQLKGLKTLMLQKMASSLSEESAVKYLNAALTVDPGNAAVPEIISFCKAHFVTLCALNPENKKFLAANLDLLFSADDQ